MRAKLVDILAAAHVGLSLATHKELIHALSVIMDCENMTASEIDCLNAMYEHGPLFDGDVPCPASRNGLLVNGYVAKVVVKGEEGHNACTYKGAMALRVLKVIKAASEKTE
jgi:hypothetical protein